MTSSGLHLGARKCTARLLLAGLCAALAACSTVPSSGPSKMAVLDDARQPDPGFLLVPISDSTLQNLARFPGPSLYGKFGDYRGAVEQRIGVGDTLEVTVYEAASGGLFSTPVPVGNGSNTIQQGSHSAQIPAQIVQQDGSITMPYAGRIRVVGRTIPEVEATIVGKLTGKAIEPQVIVTLSRNIASSVAIGGEVVKGARVALSTRGDKLLDIIADAGGISAPANESFLDLTRGGRTTRVPLQTLLHDPRENIFARPGDILTVVRYPLTFTAIGATNRNAVVPYDAVGISLEEAIGKASGVIDARADPEGVFVFRYEPLAVARAYAGLTPAQAAQNLVPTVYYINMRDPASLFLARRFSMHDKDIVYVSNSPFSDVQKLAQLASAITGPLIQGALLATYLK